MSRMHRLFTGLFLTLILPVAALAAESPAESPALRDARECTVRGGLPNFFQKVRAGKTVRIAYLGGSITAQPGWRPRTLAWFRTQYPGATIHEINAAIGGTGSDLGVFRLAPDVLVHKPDLLFVEFAVNDGGAPPERIHKTMEGIVRKTWRADPATDICFVYTLTRSMLDLLQKGKCFRSATAMEDVADHYAIPTIHMAIEVARLEKDGKLVFTGARPATPEARARLQGKTIFSPDGVHPYPDSGHQLYLEAVVRSMKPIAAVTTAAPHVLPKPLDRDNWEDARMVPLGRAVLSKGWRRIRSGDHALARRFRNRLPEMYCADQPGETLSFRFKGTAAKVYDLLGPDCGQVTVQVDGQAAVVRPRFDSYCTYHRLATLTLASGLPDAEHTVTVTMHPEQPDKAAILSRRNAKIDDPKRFDGTAWYAGALLLRGEIIK